jgi:hypothetical protein
MIKIIFILTLSLFGLSVFAEDEKATEKNEKGAVSCQNFKEGKCLDAEGAAANCCVNHVTGTAPTDPMLRSDNTNPAPTGANVDGDGKSGKTDPQQQ